MEQQPVTVPRRLMVLKRRLNQMVSVPGYVGRLQKPRVPMPKPKIHQQTSQTSQTSQTLQTPQSFVTPQVGIKPKIHKPAIRRLRRLEHSERSKRPEDIKLFLCPPHGNFNMYRELLQNERTQKRVPSPGPPLKNSQTNVRVNMCIPLWNRAQHIREVLQNLQNVVVVTKESNIKVWIADFHSTDIILADLVKTFSYPIEIVLLPPPFIIAKALQTATERMPRGEIVYFLDADAHVPFEIFERIRMYTVQGKQFYCPMVAYEQPDNSLKLPDVGKDHGGKGHIGVFVDDFMLCNGWKDPEHLTLIAIPGPGPMERLKWGGHDGHLFNKLRWDRLNVYRPRESDQYVKYHARIQGWYLQKGGTKTTQKRKHRNLQKK